MKARSMAAQCEPRSNRTAKEATGSEWIAKSGSLSPWERVGRRACLLVPGEFLKPLV